jgi:hypothetical protein
MHTASAESPNNFKVGDYVKFTWNRLVIIGKIKEIQPSKMFYLIETRINGKLQQFHQGKQTIEKSSMKKYINFIGAK